MNDAFCVLPFYRTTIRSQGSMSPCCNIHNLSKLSNESSLEEFWSSEKLNALRDNMLQGKKSKECTNCYKQEQLRGSSMRTESLRDHFVTSNTDLEKFVNGPRYLNRKISNHLEVHLGNLCNLKCLTCDPASSSSIAVENKILKISDTNNKNFQIDDSTVETLIKQVLKHKIEVLDLRGGESMLMPSIRTILTNLPSNHNIKILRLQTNCTILDNFWKDIFTKFHKVEIMLSIDAIGNANNYIRYPADWETINQNVDYFRSCKNLKLYVNCTISNLNFLFLKDVIKWCREKQIYFHYNLCNSPEYYQCTNLPQQLFNQGLEQISNYLELRHLKLTHNDSQWKDFCKMISIRDEHRKNSIFDILPDLKPYWI